MSLSNGIQQFLAGVDPVILSRGQDYFRSGNVESIEWDDLHMTAEVSGNEDEPYLVDIDFNEDGEVEAWECDCPYDWGPVCKHTAAALLAIQAEPPKEETQEGDARKISIRDLVERAEKEQLAELILEHCRKDKRFESQVLSALEDSGEQELASIKQLVRASVRANRERGYIDWDSCDTICGDLEDALFKAHRRVERGQCDQALEIALFVLLTGMNLLGEDADESPDLLWRTVDAALETVELAVQSLARSGGERGEWVRRLLDTAQDAAFEDWEDQRFDFLERIAVLADAQNESAFYRALVRLSDRRWERFADSRFYTEQEELVRYRIVCAAHGQAAGRAYLEDHVEVDQFRRMLVQEHMEAGDYAGAERLCRERIEKKAPESLSYNYEWQELLYEIYRDWGQREQQIGQARKLALCGYRKFYETTKALLIEDGRWQEAFPQLLTELKTALPARQYMEILAQENEAALLMEQVRVYQDTVFQYGGILASQYGEEICEMCSAVIRQTAKRIDNRRDYHNLCELLCSLVDFGGIAAAQTLIAELHQAYPRRPALWDEMERVERRIREKQEA